MSIVILGVGPGIGNAVALRYAKAGYDVILMARSAISVSSSADRIRQLYPNVHVLALDNIDAADPASIRDGFERIKTDSHFSTKAIKVAIYNAGFYALAPVSKLNEEMFLTAFKVNCFGAFVFAQCVLDPMMKAKSGTIIFTGSPHSTRAEPFGACVGVGKFGLRALAHSLAREVQAKYHIHVVHVLVDNVVDSELSREIYKDRTPQQMINPDAIAKEYYHVHCQDETAWTMELDIRPAATNAKL